MKRAALAAIGFLVALPAACAPAPSGVDGSADAGPTSPRATPMTREAPTRAATRPPERTPRPTATRRPDPLEAAEDYAIWFERQDQRIASGMRLLIMGDLTGDPSRMADPEWAAEVSAIASVVYDAAHQIERRREVPAMFAAAHAELLVLADRADASVGLIERSLLTQDIDAASEAIGVLSVATGAGMKARELYAQGAESFADAPAAEQLALLAMATVPPDRLGPTETPAPMAALEDYARWNAPRVDRVVAGVGMLGRMHDALFQDPLLLNDEAWMDRLGDTYLVIESAAEPLLAEVPVPPAAAAVHSRFRSMAETMARSAALGREAMADREALDADGIAASQELLQEAGGALLEAREALEAALAAQRDA